MTVAVVQYRVHGGISKNHCSSGNWPAPNCARGSLSPRIAAIFVVARRDVVGRVRPRVMGKIRMDCAQDSETEVTIGRCKRSESW
jgi:hypothetical protein